MNIKNSLLSVFLLLFFSSGFSQIGGNNTYEFLNLPFSARTASLGGTVIGVKDDDLNLTFQNPSLLDSSMNNKLAMSYVNYFSDVNYGYTAYSRTFDKIGSFSAGLQFLNYGDFIAADETGLITGGFGAAEYSFNIGYGRSIDSTKNIGATLKTIYSKLEHYTSIGSAIDIAGTYYNAKHLFTAAAVVKNIGVQWKPYVEGNKEPLPFEVQVGFSKKLAKAPFRFSVAGQHLEKWDLTYVDPEHPVLTEDPITGDPIKQNKVKIFGDKLMRHVIVGGELMLTKNFHFNFGYNYGRRQELKVDTRPGMIGFSWGLGFKISKFYLSYGRAAYHLAGASNHFTLTTNLSDFYSKK